MTSIGNAGTTLDQNIPNPFNQNTKISYQLAEPGRVMIQVFNSSGNKVAVMVNENETPGRYSANWDAANLMSGVYTYILYINSIEVSKKALKLKIIAGVK